MNAVHLHHLNKIDKLHDSGQGGIGIHLKRLSPTDVSSEESSLPLDSSSKFLFPDPSATLMCSFKQPPMLRIATCVTYSIPG